MPRDFVGEQDLGSPAVAAPIAPVGAFAPAADDVLRVLIDARQKMIRTDGVSCLWMSVADVSGGMHRVGARITAIVFIARELHLPATDKGWGKAMEPVYHFNDTHDLSARVALIDRAIAARKAEGG